MTSTAVTHDAAPDLPHPCFRFYDRAIWVLVTKPDSDEVDCVLAEGTDRRSYAALNHYLREGESPKRLRARGLPRLLPYVASGHVSFDLATDRAEIHDDPDRPGAVPVLIADQ